MVLLKIFDLANRAHISVGEVPVWSLSIGRHLPHDHTVAPDITRGGELSVCNGLWCSPSDWDFPTLSVTQ